MMPWVKFKKLLEERISVEHIKKATETIEGVTPENYPKHVAYARALRDVLEWMGKIDDDLRREYR